MTFGLDTFDPLDPVFPIPPPFGASGPLDPLVPCDLCGTLYEAHRLCWQADGRKLCVNCVDATRWGVN